MISKFRNAQFFAISLHFKFNSIHQFTFKQNIYIIVAKNNAENNTKKERNKNPTN